MMRIAQRIFLVVVLLGGVVVAQYAHDARARDTGPSPIVLFPPAVLRAADLGLDGGLASLIWLNTIQQVGESQGGYARLVNDIRTINALDPRFAYPYAFGELVLPGLDKTRVDDALAIGRMGVEQVDDWRIPFYLASAYLIYKDDRAEALRYFQIAGRNPDMPAAMRATALTFGTRGDKRESTKAIWQAFYESSDDEILREQAYNNLMHIAIVEALESAVQVYHARTGSYPPSVQALVDEHIIKELPQDPLGLVYVIENDGSIQAEIAR